MTAPDQPTSGAGEGVTDISPANRCWECGALATRVAPTASSEDAAPPLGCDACFPNWPHRPAAPAVSGDEVEALAIWLWNSTPKHYSWINATEFMRQAHRDEADAVDGTGYWGWWGR